MTQDEKYMKSALKEAQKAALKDEVPVGAVIVKDGKIISEFIANDLKHASRKFYTVDFISDDEKKEFLKRAQKLQSFSDLGGFLKTAHLSIEDKDLNGLVAILADMGVTSFTNRKESLEDYFMKFYKEDKDFKGALK